MNMSAKHSSLSNQMSYQPSKNGVLGEEWLGVFTTQETAPGIFPSSNFGMQQRAYANL